MVDISTESAGATTGTAAGVGDYTQEERNLVICIKTS